MMLLRARYLAELGVLIGVWHEAIHNGTFGLATPPGIVTRKNGDEASVSARQRPIERTRNAAITA